MAAKGASLTDFAACNVQKGSTIRELDRLRKTRSSSDGRLHWKKDDELTKLEKEYYRLKNQKQKLVERAQEAALLHEFQKHLKQQAEGEANAPFGRLANEDALYKAIELTKKKKLMETYNAYRLTGIAFVLLSDNCFRFCLDTFYKGQYFEPYYMEIKITDDDIKILRHTIPFFIPLEGLLQKYEGYEGVKEFVVDIYGYLNAFVARRQQLLQAQEINGRYSIREYYSTPAFDFVKFSLKIAGNEAEASVKLKYADLKDKFPKEVELKHADHGDDSLINNLRENLLCTEVKTAIMAVITCS